MYRVQAVYRAGPGSSFDFDYYLNTHIPMAQRVIAGKFAATRVEIERDRRPLFGGGPEAHCVFSVYLENDAELKRFCDFLTGPGAAPLAADAPNYATGDVAWTISEIV